MFHKNPLEKNVEKLRQIYPKIIPIVNGWQQLANIHGYKQTKEEKEILHEFVGILKDLGVLGISKAIDFGDTPCKICGAKRKECVC